MGDIVATIQSEQDQVIRSDLAGPLVVQGGPGTGKTAVALHRAAYLLYTHRERLSRSGVLIVGPNPLFLRYIEQVLPSLGETGVVLATAAELYPGVTGMHEPLAAVAALKGDLRMAAVLGRAVRARQRVPDGPRVLAVGSQRLTLTPADVAGARARARRSRKPHNSARESFLRDLLDVLAGRLAGSIGTTLTSDNRDDLADDLRDSPDVRRELNLAWMPLAPEQVLSALFAEPDRLTAAAAGDLDDRELALLRRPAGAPWTVADVPLLDELAELLGDVTTGDRAAQAAARQRAEDIANAEAALQNVDTMIRPKAEQIADRFAESGPVLTVAERAQSDRTWAFGHLVVDEAQEHSPMMWRLLMRRCPTRSMTLVGDVAQVGSAAGASSWGEVLDRYVPGRWRMAELTVNYRTPAQVMQLASEMLAAAGIDAPTPESVREGDWKPVAQQMHRGDPTAVANAVRAELELLGEGRLAVVTVLGSENELRAALAAALPDETVGEGSSTLDRPVSVLAVVDVKGLEFDSVVLVEPGDILAGSARGANDLYVALTRPTQRLRVLHSDPLPPGLTGLATA